MDGWNLDVDAQRAKYASGFKGGPFNITPYTPSKMTVVDAVEALVKPNFQSRDVEKMSINDPWVARYPNAKLR